MKSMDYDSGALGRINDELQSLKKTVNRGWFLVLGLSVLVVILLVALIGVGASQGRRIDTLRKYRGLVEHPNVTFASNTGNRSLNGLTYGGSLFRGTGFWGTRASLPGDLTDHAAVTVNDLVYIIGGANASNVVLDTVWVYNPVLHNYTSLSPMPQPRYRFGADVLDGKIYVVGGRKGTGDNEDLVSTTFIYDVAADSWSIGPNTTSVHSDCCAASLSGKLYVVGGYGVDYAYLATTEVFDPATNTWTRVPDMPTPRGDLMCVSFMNEVYVLGGYIDQAGNNNAFSDAMESFNPATSTWTKRPKLLTARGDAGLTVLPGNLMMLVGGEGHYQNNDTFKYPKHVNEVYVGSDQTWVQKAMIPTARFRTAATTAGGLAYVIGGADVCIDTAVCPALSTNEVFLDVDHPNIYIYLSNTAYVDNAPLTTYPV